METVRVKGLLVAAASAATTAASSATAESAATTAAAAESTTAATAAAATATASTATTAESAGAGFLRLRLIYGKRATFDFLAIQLGNRRLSFLVRRHFHESETFRATAVAIGDESG
jgi:pyruvate/2-oxoglutarate dehydrogenase complex dihydrolipoamide acyltransferase (E2) component